MQLASDVFSEYAHVKILPVGGQLMEIPCDTVTRGKTTFSGPNLTLKTSILVKFCAFEPKTDFHKSSA
jgi:hypothetical protein